MAKDIIMPDLGMDMEQGLLIDWLKQPGDTIKPGDVIAEVETDKTTVEVEVDVEGTILDLIGEPGESLTVGTVIGHVGEAGEAAPEGGGEAAAAPKAPAQAEQSEPTQETQPAKGAPTPAATKEAAQNGSGASVTEDGRVKASPLARKMAEERGISLAQVSGSGPGGRIVKADVEGFSPAEAPAAPRPATQQEAAPVLAAPTYGALPQGPDVEIQDTSKLRARIGQRMVQSKQQVPHFYVTAEIDVDPLLALRKQLNESNEDQARKVSVNDLIIKAVALTLRQFPNLNTHFYGDKVVVHKRINIGIAVALDNGGLINVVSKDADKTAIGTMAEQNRTMINRAREGKVKPEDLSGSTFTVSNLGMYDVDNFIAIVNPPEAAILAVGSAKKMPVVKEDGSLGVGTRMKATISVDHRIGNGAEAGEFMQAFKTLMENPLRLLL